ncbi:MAG TPA: pyridoxamine 5'-phosphate oxidase family protein [Rhizomicrobium sp.]
MEDDHVIHAWNLMEKIGTAMLITWDGTAQRARPMAATVKPAEHAIYFLTDARREKVEQIENFPLVTLAFADTGGQKYVVTTGMASVSDDRAKIRDLWSPFAKAWFDSVNDPNIRVLKVSPSDAELWDSPGTLITTVKMLAAAASGTKHPDVGENRKVAM